MINRITLLLFIGLAWGQVTVDGNAYLENQTTHDSIQVLFERIAPSSLIYTTTTDVNGYYKAQLETGIYDITYSTYGYYTEWLIGEQLYSNTTLPDIILGIEPNIIYVPEDNETIQEALDVAFEDVSIIVSAGTYYENIIWPAHDGIKLIGSGEDNCVIDGNQNGGVIRFESDLDGIIGNTTLISNYTIQNGSDGGIYCSDANPKEKV